MERSKIFCGEGDVNLSPNRAWWMTNHLSKRSRDILERDAEVFLHQSLSTPCLNVLTRAHGTELVDLEGRIFLDFHGNSVHQVGFGHPDVIAAVRHQLETLSFCPRRYTNLPAVELAERLTSLAPADLGKVLFAPGGATAVGMALKLARVATGRHKTVSMWKAFHGASLDAISVGGEAQFRAGIGPLLPGTEHVPPAEPYRCVWHPGRGCEGCDLTCARIVEYVLEQEGDVAAVIAEPVRCTTVDVPPKGYWKKVREACDRHGALLVFDETAICLGRTGQMFASQAVGVTPDIMVLGKGLGGGILPFAAIVARRDLDIAEEMSIGHYTHEKSPVACAAALATLDVIEKENLLWYATDLGGYATKRLSDIKDEHILIGDIRSFGLMLAIELVRPDGVPAGQEADAVMYRCLAKGLSFKVSQGNILTLTPPLTVAKADLDRALGIIHESLSAIEGEYGFIS